MFPPYQRPAAAPDRDGAGTAALVLSLLALLLTCLIWGIVFAVPVGAAAVLYGVVGVDRARRGEASNGGMALAGLTLGAVVTAAAVGFLAWLINGLGNAYL